MRSVTQNTNQSTVLVLNSPKWLCKQMQTDNSDSRELKQMSGNITGEKDREIQLSCTTFSNK